MNINLAFPHDYELNIVSEIPYIYETESRFYYPGASQTGGQDGITVNVNPPEHLAWLGTFAFGDGHKNWKSGIFSCPQKRQFCVVSRGQGYVVHSDNPLKWLTIHALPIVEVQCLVEHNLLLFIDFTKITAFGTDGLLWVSESLSWDGIKITYISSEWIHGLGWNAPEDRETEFRVNITSGQHIGGSSSLALI